MADQHKLEGKEYRAEECQNISLLESHPAAFQGNQVQACYAQHCADPDDRADFLSDQNREDRDEYSI